MKYFFIISIACLLAACSKDRRISSPVIGSWKLHASYVSPGGATEWQEADPENPQYLTFKKNGRLIQEPGNPYASTNFKVKNDSVLLFIRGNEEFEHRYQINGDTLILSGPCIEACTYQYRPTVDR